MARRNRRIAHRAHRRAAPRGQADAVHGRAGAPACRAGHTRRRRPPRQGVNAGSAIRISVTGPYFATCSRISAALPISTYTSRPGDG